MPVISICVRDAEPNPALVVALRRVTGGSIADLASAVSQGTPLYEEEVFDQPADGQVERLQELLRLLRVTALQVVISEDGREIEEMALLNQIRAWQSALARTRAAG